MWTSTRVNWKLPAIEVVHTFHSPSTTFDVMSGLTTVIETDVVEFLKSMSTVEFIFNYPPKETVMAGAFTKTTSRSDNAYKIDIDRLMNETDDVEGAIEDDFPSMLEWVSAAAAEHLASGEVSSIDVKIVYA